MAPRQADGWLERLAARRHPAASLIPTGIRLETPLAAALNHLLASQEWARERLRPFAGQSLEVVSPPLPRLVLAVEEDGLLAAAGSDAPTTLTVRVKPEAPAALMRGEDHVLRAVEVTGDPQFADAILHLVRHLRWDFEADLARVFGDIAGYRMAEDLRAFAAWQRDAARRLADSAAAYATDEKGLLVRRQEHEGFAAGVAGLRDAVDRLEQRVRRLGPTT